jgi:toxin ParE1/3/4
MSQYRLSGDADSDLMAIWLSIADNDIDAADRVMKAIVDKFVLLAKNTKMGRARPELAPRLRSFPEGKYIILYRLAPDAIEIVRVLHGARDIESIFGGP